jgi:hypothetical protein
MVTPSLYFHGVHLGDFLTPEMSKKNKAKTKTQNNTDAAATPRRKSNRKRNRTDKGMYYDSHMGENDDDILVLTKPLTALTKPACDIEPVSINACPESTHTHTNIVNLTNMDVEEWMKGEKNVYIGRESVGRNIQGSKWGNKYTCGTYGREKAVSLYESDLMKNEELLGCLKELDGKNLGCWCFPKKCHGEVLHRLLHQGKSNNESNDGHSIIPTSDAETVLQNNSTTSTSPSKTTEMLTKNCDFEVLELTEKDGLSITRQPALDVEDVNTDIVDQVLVDDEQSDIEDGHSITSQPLDVEAVNTDIVVRVLVDDEQSDIKEGHSKTSQPSLDVEAVITDIVDRVLCDDEQSDIKDRHSIAAEKVLQNNQSISTQTEIDTCTSTKNKFHSIATQTEERKDEDTIPNSQELNNLLEVLNNEEVIIIIIIISSSSSSNIVQYV